MHIHTAAVCCNMKICCQEQSLSVQVTFGSPCYPEQRIRLKRPENFDNQLLFFVAYLI